MEHTDLDAAVDECQGLMTSLEAMLREPRTQKGVAWGELGFPVVDKGTHAVFPLLVSADPAGDSASARGFQDVNARLFAHWGFQYGGHGHRVGRFKEGDEWGKQALGAKFVAAGAQGPGPIWWDISHHVVIHVTSREPHGVALTGALHVVPRDWVFSGILAPSTKRAISHCRSVVREVAAADLRWDWTTLVADPSALWVTHWGAHD